MAETAAPTRRLEPHPTGVEASPPVDVVAVVDEYRAAYEARDLDRLLDLFADDAELTAAPGTFRGKGEIRAVLAWDAELSPTATVRDAGAGVIVSGRTAAWERAVGLTYKGIPYEEHAVSVVEVDESGHIRRFASYYDKLAVMHQIAAKLPGVQGRVFRQLTGYLVRQGSTGLDVPPA